MLHYSLDVKMFYTVVLLSIIDTCLCLNRPMHTPHTVICFSDVLCLSLLRFQERRGFIHPDSPQPSHPGREKGMREAKKTTGKGEQEGEGEEEGEEEGEGEQEGEEEGKVNL